MNNDEILAVFAETTNELPEEALRYCLAHQEQVTPYFLQKLQDFVDEDGDNWQVHEGIFFITHLLADMEAQQAFPLFIRLLEKNNINALDEAFGPDLTTVSGSLISTYNGDQQALERIIMDASLNEFHRDFAFNAWGYLVADNRIDRKHAEQFLKKCGDEMLPRSENMVWGGWLSNSSLLGFESLKEEGLKIIVDGRMPERLTSSDYYLKDLENGMETQDRSKLFHEFHVYPFEDIIGNLKTWAAFNKQDDVHPAYSWNPSHQNMPVFNDYRDVGRNDPCPCGSGKKFKKCCLH
ncbi:hypothetical protein GCM10011332_16070 [Terasakiella brassicae]|uniref:SEC-C motif-containing protein n=1 Tax=Terasakiella brassicae TaxID=1634917 RepID=A0A917BYE2_9PROT|nr:DUF1186 domain-containing protein [Terasakiella brassicae]GGF62942.1 hypothetical protein GCM10011332_16070 [Terasakiella brassicae]